MNHLERMIINHYLAKNEINDNTTVLFLSRLAKGARQVTVIINKISGHTSRNTVREEIQIISPGTRLEQKHI